MSDRRRYIVAYDIRDEVRLRQVYGVVRSFGSRLQYSVFLCDLSVAERAELEAAVVELMHLMEDSFVQIDLGPASAASPIRSLGRAQRLPDTGPQIV